MANKSKAEKAYVDMQSSRHDIKKVKKIMNDQDEIGLKRIKAAAKFGGLTWNESIREKSWFSFLRNTAIMVSFIPLLITAIVYFVSPVLIGVSQFDNQYFSWGLTGLLLVVAVAATIAIDFGRTAIFKHNKTVYAVLSLVSVMLSGLGLAAVAYMYNSNDLADIKNKLQDSRTALIQNGATRSIEEIKAELDAKSTKYHSKGTHYGKIAYYADRDMLEEELRQVQATKSASGALDNRHELLKSVDSSNMLGNVVATIIELNANQGIVLAAILFIFAVELVIWLLSGLIELLQFRINITQEQYYAACYSADRVTVASDSTLKQQYDARMGEFVHSLASMPIDLIGHINVPNAAHAHATHVNEAPALAPAPQPIGHEIGADDPNYQNAKKAAVGSQVNCPQCGTEFKKNAHNQVFCSGKGKGNCRDEYHNLRDPARMRARRG